MYTAKHIGEGKFEIIIHETDEIKNAGKNLCGMIRYMYFEDYTLPPIGWGITQKQLMEDYHQKVEKDVLSGNIVPK